jgi:D-alanine-D-alanine ligase
LACLRQWLVSISAAPDPIRVGLVFGGASGEHDVSIRSAVTVLGGLRSGANGERYDVRGFYIDRQGRWWPPAVAEPVLARGTAPESESAPEGQPRPGFQGFPEGALEVDVWFPVLHGPNGEDGTIQGLFTLMQRPFVGSGVLGSAVGMDKQAMKAAFAAAGLPQVPYLSLSRSDMSTAAGGEPSAAVLERIEGALGYPCFVKPANLGSSVGISKATDRHSLQEGLRTAAALDSRLVVEQGVVARELECAVLGPPEALEASVLGEIRFDADWYDYEAKYSAGRSQTLIPAPVAEAVRERARSMAIAACLAVGASGLSRVDFFYSEPDDALWVNEINTLPGFTSHSMYPMLWEASGLPLAELLHRLLQNARESFPSRQVTP